MVKLTPQERIERVVCWAGLSTNAFAAQIGLSSPQSLYQIKSGKHGISRTIAERICNRYPDIDFGWLMTGEGEMLRPLDKPIPYYNLDCTDVVCCTETLLASGLVTMPRCGDCDFVAPYNSRDMEPSIMQGSLLFCKWCEVEDVCVGDTVVVSSARMAMVRKVAEVGGVELLLEATTQEPLPTRLDTTLIRAIYKVKAVLEWKSI